MPSDDEWELPLQKRREMARKPDNVTLSLPTKSILTILAASCTKFETIRRNEVKLVTKLFKAVGADLNDDSLNIPTIRHQKKYKGKTDAKGSKVLFHPLKNLITHSWFFILMER